MPLATFALLLFPACLGAYLFLAGALSRTELIAGVPLALACTAAATLFRLREERSLRLVLPPLRVPGHVLVALVSDTARVGWLLLRAIAHRPQASLGTVSAQPFDAGDARPGAAPKAAGRRALATLAASVAPNGYVLTLADGMLLHRLSETRPSDDAMWPR